MPIPFTLDIATQPQQKDIKWVAAGDWASFDDTVIGLAAGDAIQQATITVKIDPTDADDAVTSVQRTITGVESANGVVTADRLLFYFQPADTEKMVTAHHYDLQIWVTRGATTYIRTILRGRIYARQDITNSTVLLDPMTTLTITNGATATGAPGSTLQLIAEVRDGGGVLHPEYNPIWSTSNGAVATVDATGLMRFWAAGTSVVSATLAAFGLADSINVTVSGSAMLTALNGDVLTFDGSVWNPANPNTRFVLRGGDTVVGVYTFSDTTQSTSVATGGVVLAGGLGIAKNLWVGGTLNVAGISTLASVLGTSITGSVYVAVSSGVDVWGMAATATSLTLRKVGVADYIQMTATAFTPYAASGMTLGTAALPWGAVYSAAASFTTGAFSGDVNVGAGKFVVTAATGAASASGKITGIAAGEAALFSAASTSARWITVGNTGGDVNIGIDGSTGATFAYGNYATVISRPAATPFAVGRAGAADLLISGTGAATFGAALAITGALTGVTDLSMGQQLLQTVASGSSVGHGLAQTGVVRWDITNTATSGLFAISESGVANWLTIAKTTGTVTFAGAVTAGAASFTTGAFSGAVTVTGANINLSNAYYLSAKLAGGSTVSILGMTAADKVVLDPNGYGVLIGAIASTTATQFVVGASTFVVTAATGAVSVSGKITSTVVAAEWLDNVSGTTSGMFLRMQNTGVAGIFGIEGSVAGTRFIGTDAYAILIGTGSAKSIQLATNNTVALTIASTGAATFASSLAITGALTGVTSAALSDTLTITKAGSAWLSTTTADTTTYGRFINNSGGTPHTLHVGVYDAGTLSGGAFIGSFSNHDFVMTTNNVERITIAAAGSVKIHNLAGVGTRAVVVDANGVLSAP